MEGKITKVFNAADQIQAEMIHDHLKSMVLKVCQSNLVLANI